MASALAALANATVTFTVATSGTTTDATTGNVLPNTTTIEVSAYLKADTQEVRRYPGVDIVETLFSGWAVDPTALDSRINEGTAASVVFAGEAALSCEVLAARRPFGSSGLIGATLAAALGDTLLLRSTEQR